ncbi:MAG: DNA methyltransferase [Candidatus Hadarchaeum sp.]
MKLQLHDDVQFIYELILARKEASVFVDDYFVSDDMREFEVVSGIDVKKIIKRCAYFKLVNGLLSDYHWLRNFNRTRSFNQYLTHWFYPYKGKFHPQMIRAFLNIAQVDSGDWLLDPFVGSGTAALEAQLLGINFIGFDISPLCILQSKVKTQSLDVLDTIADLQNEVESFCIEGSEKPNLEDIDDERVKNFYRLAEMIALSDRERRRRDFKKSFISTVDKMVHSLGDYKAAVDFLGLELGKVDLRIADSRNLPLESGCVDVIITSPPYSMALDYIENDCHSLQAMGCDLTELRSKFIGLRGKGLERVNYYFEDMEKCYREMYRVLKPGSKCIVVVGNVTYQGKEVKISDWTKNVCIKCGFKLVEEIPKVIFGLYNFIQREFIQIYEKPNNSNILFFPRGKREERIAYCDG